MIRTRVCLYLVTWVMLIAIGGMSVSQAKSGPSDPKTMEAELQQGLDKLVAEQVITEQQAAKVLQYFQTNKPSGPPPPNTSHPTQPPQDPLSQMVKDGVITREQAKAIAAVLPKPPQPQDGNNPPPLPRS